MEFSVIFIIIAAIIDGMDGRITRILKSTSNFGAQLDSFADFLNFGAAPALIAGVRRSVFANKAGTGTAAIVHSAVKEEDPIKVGCVAMITPLIDTILISFLTGIVIIITSMHSTDNVGDITLISSVFSTVLPLFSKLGFPLMMFSFTFSTIIAYCYYCEVALLYLFGNKKNTDTFPNSYSGFSVY